MTTTTTASHIAYTGSGITPFTVPFNFWDQDELDVFLRTIADGTEQLQVITTNYTVSGGLGSNGAINFVVAPTSSFEIHIRRRSNQSQEKDLTPATVLPNAAIEEALDRLALRFQELFHDQDALVLKIPETDVPVSGTAPDMTLPNLVDRQVLNALMGFDLVTGNPIVTTAVLPSASVTAFGADLIDEVDAAGGRGVMGSIFNRGGLMDSIEADLLASRDAEATFGEGLFYATDERRLFYSDASTWIEVGIGQFSGADPASGNVGRLFFNTQKREFRYDDGATVLRMLPPLPRGYQAGCELGLTGASQDVIINPGQVAGGLGILIPDAVNGIVTASMTKQLDTGPGWVAGNNQPGRPSVGDALGADKWHHVFVLINPTTGAVDMGFDDDFTGAALLADATVLAAGFTMLRYRGSVKENSGGPAGTCLPFFQTGGWFRWQILPGLDVDLVAADYTGSQTSITLDFVPPGQPVIADIVARSNSANQFLFAGGGVTITADPGASTAPLASHLGITQQMMKLFTNVSQQIEVRGATDPTVELDIETHGYFNFRHQE